MRLGATPPESQSGETRVVCPIRDDGSIARLPRGVQPRRHAPHRSARARAARDAVRVPGRRHPQLAPVRRDRRDQAILEQLIASAGDAIVSVDGDGKIRGWNPAAERIFGQSMDQVVGQPFAEPRAAGPAAARAGGALARESGAGLRRHHQASGRSAAEPGRHALVPARARRRARGPARHRARHHRPARDRGADAPVREAHRARPDGGRHRPRLQQPAPGDPRLRPAHGPEPGERRRGPPRSRRDREGGQRRRGDRAPHPEVRAATPRRAVRDDGPQPGRPRLAGHHAAALGGEEGQGRRAATARAGAGAGPGRHGPARRAERGHHQPHPERDRRHARGRHPPHPHAPG